MAGCLTAAHEGILERSEAVAAAASLCTVRLELLFREVAKVISVL